LIQHHEQENHLNAPTPASALAVSERQQFDLSPQTFEQALTFSQYLADSEMVPKNFRGKAGDCLIAMQWGYEVGLKPLQALQNISVINGKPGLYGDAGKAILLAAGCIIEEDDIRIVENNQFGRCKITRPGRPPVERTFSLENAKTAGLWGKEGPWRTHPWRQMAWRAFWFAARDAAADLLKGLIGAEEAQDLAEKHMGMVDEVRPQTQPALPQPTQPVWPDDAFGKQIPRWTKAVLEGIKSVDEILAMAKSKGSLTPAQEQQIKDIKRVQQQHPAAPAEQQAETVDPFVAALDAAEQGAGQ